VPKAKPFPEGEEEEKTTIESQWEEEASTTVEQGDVADKIRSLNVAADARRGNTNQTNTGAVEEPTVDDKQMSAITPVRDVARMQITQGNDAGTEVEIRPGKTYTIGRAIDNDIVLTDIAVSRKHFDLRFEDAAWVIADRGSGNGTVVNGNLEDNPFMLANGDMIEIGNTVFRFDQPHAPSRPPQRTIDLDRDDEEMSTVAGKPLRETIEPAPPIALRHNTPPPPPRPKTLPPPAPRPAVPSQSPPLGYAASVPSLTGTNPLPALPASTLPLPQMANRPPPAVLVPSYGPGSPAILGDPITGLPGLPPATLPGQGAPPQQRPMYGYPQAAEIPPHSVHAQMLMIQTANRRGDASTAHVPPTPYEVLPLQHRFASQPQLTKKAKMVLLGISIVVFAAVMTVAIVKSSSSKKPALAATSSDKTKKPTTKPKTSAPPPKTITSPTAPTPPAPPPTTTAGKAAPAPQQPPVAQQPPSAQPQVVQQVTPPKPAPTPTPPRLETKTATPTTTVKPPEAVPKEPDPPKVVKAEPKTTRTNRNKNRRNEARRDETRRDETRRDTQVAVTTASTPKRGGDPADARAEADRLYRARKFNEASSYLSSQAKKFDEDIAKDLRRTSDFYAKLGRFLSQGTAQATNAADKFEALRSAKNYDSNLGNAFDGEIESKLAQVAPSASLLYIARKKYPAARGALLVARQFNASSDTVKVATNKLEGVASELYNEALEMQSSDPGGAKDRYKMILQIVDSTSTWYKKAQQKLSN
jgi:hypothetical protein